MKIGFDEKKRKTGNIKNGILSYFGIGIYVREN